MIEMALVLPVLILLVFGAIEYGWAFLKASQISNAARQGVRAAIPPDATTATVQAAVDAAMTQGGLTSSGYTTTITSLNATIGAAVTVKVVVPDYTKISLVGGLVPRPTQLSAAASMAKEGP